MRELKTKIIYLYNKTESYFLDDINDKYSFLLFQKGLYTYLIISTLYLLPIAPELWGANSFSPVFETNFSVLNKVFNLLQLSSINQYYYLIIGLQLLFLFWGLLKSNFRIIGIIIYALTVNLFNKTYLMNSGAQQLIALLLFFMMLVNVSNKPKTTILQLANNSLSNIGILACKIQLIILYIFSAFYKYTGTYWLNGEALFYALKIEDYNPIWITSQLTSNNLILQFGTYLILAYLTLFPIAVWFKRVKLRYLLFGVFIHLGIAFVMGIVDLGLIMVVSYLIFIPNEKAKAVLKKFSIKKG